MKQRKWRMLTLMLSTLIVLGSILSACGSSENKNDNASQTSDKAASNGGSTEAKLDPYVIKWYLPQGIFPDAPQVIEEMNKITKAKINATLDVQFVDWGNYDQKMQTVLASGEQVDLMFTSNWTNDYVSNVAKGAYLDISDLLQKYGQNILKQVPEKAWDAAKINGKLYAIINTQVVARKPGMLVNGVLLDKYGFKEDQFKKLEDFTPFLEKVVQGEQGKYAFRVKGNDDQLTYIGTALGLEYFGNSSPAAIRINDPATKVVNLYETPEYIGFLKLMREWYQKGIIRKDASTITDTTADEQAGKYVSRIGVMNPDNPANNANVYGEGKAENVKMVSFGPPYMSTGSIIATMTAIPATSKDPDRAMMLYDLMYADKDLFNLMNFGIEGKHYTKVKDDLIALTPNSGYAVNSGWEFGNLFNAYRTNPDQPAWIPTGPDMNNSAVSSPILGFSFDPSKVKSELSQCASAISEFSSGLVTGAIDPDVALPKLNDKLKKAGMEKLLAEMQSQIDAWKAANGK
ncbi:ABC transporter substrate-binding protein [Paenibacillus lignilyticus]|uniref:ABC transporter substrate-binding protein n=1 Tax=Paenibacillus lignilyticus TaxID=1172615 RepID=A0ABS5CIZ4_9BACL|nr:ABC transporter substrate-binding protein [Paenibacillus lignilyticus]MBP3965839.1 ABC transporter substrate-binding protein [Paenibacillus lignilyticus]